MIQPSILHGESSTCSLIPRLSVPQGWSFCSMTSEKFIEILHATPVSHQRGLPALRGRVHHYDIKELDGKPKISQKRKGWQGPGPGPKRGLKRIPCLEDLYMPLMIAVIHLTKEAVHFQQVYSFESYVQDNNNLTFSSTMNILNAMEDELPISRAMRKCIWPLSHQLGVPAFLVKLRSPFHAIALHYFPQTQNSHWRCSQCKSMEIDSATNCIHSVTVKHCIELIASKLGCTDEYLVCSMAQSSAFHHIPEMTPIGFYGFRRKPEFAITCEKNGTTQQYTCPIDPLTPIHIAKRISSKHGWKCLNDICSGNATNCAHYKAVNMQIQKGLSHCFSSVHELVSTDEPSTEAAFVELDTEQDDIQKPGYARPLIPSEVSFQVDFNVNRNARTNSTQLIQASERCFCGRSMYDNESSNVSREPLRVESLRCFLEYEQEIWYCGDGHCVTPQDASTTREGLIWISKDTAFTEVFLFEVLLYTTLAGTTISSQAHIRSQMLHLQTNYMNTSIRPRSTHTLRKALITYAMAVVQSIPPWVFRCSKCATSLNGHIYYDKLSFDGQQLGFNIRKDVRYDFYGKPSNPWRRPVDRCNGAYSATMMIESTHLCTIITEALRVRSVPIGCNSVEALCRAMMRVPLRAKDTIRAAIAALKLFDTNWWQYVPNQIEIPNLTTVDTFSSTFEGELSAHPIQFITKINPNEAMRAEEFDRGKRVMHVFEEVLDCTAAAAVLSVLLDDLKADLKAHIPIHDIEFLQHHATYSRLLLHQWLTYLSPQESQTVPLGNQQALNDNTRPGISEYADTIQHPFRAPFTWMYNNENDNTSRFQGKRLACIRQIGPWVAPDEAQVSVLLLFMAILTESVVVWVRDGNLDIIKTSAETFRQAELHCGRKDVQYHYRDGLKEISSIGLLYEGTMGLIGANTPHARQMFSACRGILELIEERLEGYEALMALSESRKPFMCSPKEFDEMLCWTDAFKRENNMDTDPLQPHAIEMKRLYQKLAKSKTNDFLESGIWAPDFPIQRPSPSSSMWASETSNTEISCSKDFSVHTAFSPGTFGGYCLCRHAKTVMISFLKRPEGCLMPLNFLVERCATLPKYVIYDFACGTQKSAAVLSSELSKNVRFVIDPFHFPGHKTCSLAMHQFNYEKLRGSNSERQEQRNGRIKVMERTLRASRDIHFIHLVILAHAYLNLKAIFMDHYDTGSEESDMPENLSNSSWIKWIRDNLFTE